MDYPPDPRVTEALAIPMAEVVDRLCIPGLRKQSGELIGPCPICGGKDRFGINLFKGCFGCRVCGGAGDAFQLVRFFYSCDFRAAVSYLVGAADIVRDPAEVAAALARAAAAKAAQAAASASYRQWAIDQAVKVWRSAQEWRGTQVEQYFTIRGIPLADMGQPFGCFRYLPAHPYIKKTKDGRKILHTGPALISGVADHLGRLRAVHQTWIDLSSAKGKAEIIAPDGAAMPAKLVLGSKKGGAIRLTGAHSGPVLVMGEGIETTLSAMVAGIPFAASYWAGVDLGNMSGIMERAPGQRHSGRPDLSDADAFVPPVNISHLIFIQDGDSAHDMTRAKLESGLRRAAHHLPGLRGQIVHAGAGIDLNDKLRGAP